MGPGPKTAVKLGLLIGFCAGFPLALSLVLLTVAGWYVLRLASRVFRVALLLYGKTWNLPEILRWARRA